MIFKIGVAGLFILSQMLNFAGSESRNGNYRRDITEEKFFNCHWSGGMEASLYCDCITGDEVFYIAENDIPPQDIHTMNISHCGRLTFAPHSITAMRNLRHITLNGIRSIIFENNSFYWPGYDIHSRSSADGIPPALKISIENSAVDNIHSHAFKGSLQYIAFKNTIIRNIEPFAFSLIRENNEIYFEDVNFDNIHPQAFKKFATQRLFLVNCRFGIIPSKAFYDLTVYDDFILRSTQIDTLKPHGFVVNKPRRVEVSACRIENLNGDAFKISTRGGVWIRSNIFNSTNSGAFRSITLDKEEEQPKQPFNLEDNIFNSLGRNSLNIDRDSFIVRYNTLELNQICDCDEIDRVLVNGEDLSQFRCLYEGTEWVTVKEFKTHNCAFINTKYSNIIIITCVTLILIILIAAGLTVYFKKMYRCGSYGRSDGEKNGKISMIVPDGRTYIQTEIQVQVERADLLTTDL